ncbi:MAG: S8 family serine peptidase, partial [Candidatus Promineifilaceae bacterium]|nr:S8 family serine peptidase [Candidatus Promineifilaceae bacterium]
PGVQILAGASPQHVGPGAQGELFQAIQGTSMSSPHVAGAAALLAAIHRDWTPAEIESALMTTTNRNQFKKDGVTPADPFDTGSGRIDLKSAVQAPLVLDELYANYLSADPGKNGDPSTLNIASLADADCVNSCDWTRVLRNTTSETMSWRTSLSNLNGTVIPGNFTLQPNEEISIEVTVDATGMSRGEWTFGSLDIIPQSGGGGSGVVPSTHMPIAIIPDERIVAEVVDILTRRDAGSHLVENLLGPEITDLNLHAKGLVPGENFLVTLAEDPTPDDPFDNLNQVWWQLVPVMPDSSRLVNEIRESEAQDVHLYIGFDSNGDRKPDEDEVECIGMTAGGDAYCNLEYPQEGDWWVLVQNRNSTQMGLFDSILLSTGIVGNFDGGNMMFDAPATVPVQEPFDLRIKYDLQNLVEGQVWYGSVDVGTDANNSDNIARIEINLYRVSDDVTKQVNIHYPAPGDRVVFDILIQPNVLDEDIEYEVNDMIPDGMTYVSESARASAGAVEVVDNKLTWIGTLLNPNQLQPSYKMSTSDSDLACDTGFNGYVNLEDHGIFTQETVQGDSKAFRFFATGGPIMFFGQQFDSLYITDDGFAVFDPDQNYQGQGHIPQLIPDKLKPNNIAAMLWQDMRIVYDKEKNHGVSAATVGSNVMIVEYDDIQRKDSASQTYDFEIIMTRQVNDVPGAYEIVFAYDNIHVLDEGAVTVGVEDAAGQIGTTLINQESAVNVLKNGLMVCFDTIKPSSEPVVISYEVQINEDVEIGTEIINQVISTISHIGSKPEATTSQVTVSYRSFLPINLVMNISE